MSGIFDEFGGSLTADVLSFNPDAIQAPDTLVILMKRGERRIADELRKQFGGFRRVVIDVDGERHEFSADSLIRLLEGYEGAMGASRYGELFGTPERAARTMAGKCCDCCECVLSHACDRASGEGCLLSNEGDYDALLEWLRSDA